MRGLRARVRWSWIRGWRVAMAALALAAATGCGQPQSRSGTNTNWLRACALDSDCGPSLGCECGRCSLPCTTNAECGDDTACASESASLLQCAGTSSPMCLTPCASSADCQAPELCHFGSCADPLAPSRCASHPDALVCDDFETGSTNLVEVVTAGNSIAIRPYPTPSGESVLEATVTAAPSVAYLRADIGLQTSGTLFLRGWVRVPDAAAGYDLAPLGLWSDGEVDWALRLVVKDALLELWSYTTPLTAPVALVPGAWHCLQATVLIGEAPDGAVEIAVDGDIVATATEVDTLPTGGIDSMTVGTQWAGAPATIQVDRVYLGPSAVGCWE